MTACITDSLHVEMRRADNEIRFYLDGVQIKKFTGAGNPDLNTKLELPIPFGAHNLMMVGINTSHSYNFEFTISANGKNVLDVNEAGGGIGIVNEWALQVYNPKYLGA